MPSAMPYDTVRQKMIRKNMREQEESVGGVDRLPHEKLVLKGGAQSQPIYRMDVEDLAYNKVNGRIKAEVLEKEQELGRFLEESNREDQKIIKEILLSIRPDENDKIQEDLEQNGQLRPGIITCDGIVINGNRRKAILKKLYVATSKDKYKYLDVQVLPSDITKAELWLIEAGIQLSASQQLDYSPINHLLKLREGIDAGLHVDQMAARIYGVDEDKINADLSRLDLIDEYLQDFLIKPRRYYLVKRFNEHFIDLQNILSWAERPRGNLPLDWKPDKSDVSELKLVAFYYIRVGYSHLRIRELRNLFATSESWKSLNKVSNIDVQLLPEEREELGLQPKEKMGKNEPTDTDETEPQEENGILITPAEEQDSQEEAIWREKNKKALKEYYEDAKEQEQIIKDSQRPLTLATRALKIIEAIPEDRKKLSEQEIDDVLRRIIVKTNVLRKLLQKQRPKILPSRR